MGIPWAEILLLASINILVGAILFVRYDDGRVMEWCQRWGRWYLLRALAAAFFWPVGLWRLFWWD